MPFPHTTRIALQQRPDPDKYAAAILGFQWVLTIVGLSDIATIWPDHTIVTDEQLNALSDRWNQTNTWS